jgi:FHS family L-fucose permease-like MFS transporter
VLIFVACVAIFVYGMVSSMLGTINPGLATKFHLDNIQTGYLALAQGVGFVIASVSGGALMDRKGKKIGLLLGLGLESASLFLLASAPGFTAIIVAMVGMGIGAGIILTGANALGSDVSESKRAAVLNFLNVFVGLGGLATPFVAGNLLSGDAVRVAYAGATITSATFVLHVLTKMPKPIRAGNGVPSQGSSAVFQRPVLYVLALVIFLYTACEFGMWNWLVKYLISRGIQESSALNILSLGFALGLLLGRVAIAPVLMKIPPLHVVLGAAVLMAITTYSVLQVSDPTMAAVAVFCSGLAMAPVFPTTLAVLANIFQQGTATAIGFTITCGFTGLTVSSPIIGWLSGTDPGGLRTALMVLPIFSIMIVGIALSLLRSKAVPDGSAIGSRAQAGVAAKVG